MFKIFIYLLYISKYSIRLVKEIINSRILCLKTEFFDNRK